MPSDVPKRVIHARDVSFSVPTCTRMRMHRCAFRAYFKYTCHCTTQSTLPLGVFALSLSLSLSPFPTLQNLRAAKREWSFSTGESTYQCLSKEDKDGDRQIDTENGRRGERMYNGEKLVPKVAAFSGNPQRFQSSTVFSMLRGRREERGGGGISVK